MAKRMMIGLITILIHLLQIRRRKKKKIISNYKCNSKSQDLTRETSPQLKKRSSGVLIKVAGANS